MTPKKSENLWNATRWGISSEYTLFAIKDIRDIQRKKYLFGNDNLWPLDVYNGPSQIYRFKPEGKILDLYKGFKMPMAVHLSLLSGPVVVFDTVHKIAWHWR